MNATHGICQLVSFLILTFVVGRILNESTTLRQGLLSNVSVANGSSVRDVCELNNSCSTPSNASTTTGKPSEKNLPEKWHYNVSGRNNETTETIHSVLERNDTTNGLSFDIDVTKVGENRSAPSNDQKPVTVRYHIQPEENCFCDITVRYH